MNVRLLKREDIRNGFLLTLKNLAPVADELTADVVFEEIKKNPNEYIYVVEDAKNIIGTTTLLVEQKFIHNGGRVGHLEDVAVRKGNEGRGVASLPIKKVIEAGKIVGCYKIILNCAPELEHFYQKFGFEKSGIQMRLNL